MKHRALLLFVALAIITTPALAASPSTPSRQPPRTTQLFDANWRFTRGDPANADRPGFDAAAWQSLDLPHDWSIAGPFAEAHPTGPAGAFLPAGVGWYRKQFTLPPDAAGKRIFIDFDGVMANSTVWINGVRLGERPDGYVSFRYDLTGLLKFGAATNVIAVRCDNALEPASRWAPGAGIYRHVHLVETDPLHIQQWGTFVTTPTLTNTQATVRVASTVVNQSTSARTATLSIDLFAPNGHLAAHAIVPAHLLPAEASFTFTQNLTVPHPDRWDIDHPVLYRAVVHVLSKGLAVDDDTVPFGIREFHFDPATGFWLNGRNFKIKGAAIHAEYGAFGAAVPLDAWRHRLLALRALGVNAIRTAHNPPSPEFLDLCDQLGFLVMDEMFDCWTVGKTPFDYHLDFLQWYKTDTRDTVMRDRNHPSIILWSAGNEIHDTPNAPLAHRILGSLVAVFHANDPTRPVTMALFRPNVSHDYDNGLADLLDVVGQNYRPNEILAAHAQNPARKIIGTENGHQRESWLSLRNNPPYSGQFLWSGTDYLGEAHVWPYIGNSSGLLDRTDFPHPRGLERQSWWSATPMVRIVRRVAPTAAAPTDPGEATDSKRPHEVLFPDWTPIDLGPHTETVEVYSNAPTVELILNGHSLGSQPIHTDASPRTWQVPFAPGTLRAVATDTHHNTVATDQLRTAGPPARIVLTADTTQLAPDFNSAAFISATVVDANGTVVPSASDLITFQVTGPGLIAAVDNADNTSHESFQPDPSPADSSTAGRTAQRSAFLGRCVAFLQTHASTGDITLTATSPNLTPATISLAAPAAAAP